MDGISFSYTRNLVGFDVKSPWLFEQIILGLFINESAFLIGQLIHHYYECIIHNKYVLLYIYSSFLTAAKHRHDLVTFLCVMILLYRIHCTFYTHNLGNNLRQPEHPWIKWEHNYYSWKQFSRNIAYSIVARSLSKPP